MADLAPIDIPNRPLFKATEVCDLLKVQSYVLRSWEAEFPALGVPQPSGGRVYRRQDVEQVVRIRHLLVVEGLTLAGARRKLENEAPPVIDMPTLDAAVAKKARERISNVKRGLRSLLDLLGEPVGAVSSHTPETLELELTPPEEPRSRARAKAPVPARGRATQAPSAKAARPASGSRSASSGSSRASSRTSSSSSSPGRSPRRKRSA